MDTTQSAMDPSTIESAESEAQWMAEVLQQVSDVDLEPFPEGEAKVDAAWEARLEENLQAHRELFNRKWAKREKELEVKLDACFKQQMEKFDQFKTRWEVIWKDLTAGEQKVKKLTEAIATQTKQAWASAKATETLSKEAKQVSQDMMKLRGQVLTLSGGKQSKPIHTRVGLKKPEGNLPTDEPEYLTKEKWGSLTAQEKKEFLARRRKRSGKPEVKRLRQREQKHARVQPTQAVTPMETQ